MQSTTNSPVLFQDEDGELFQSAAVSLGPSDLDAVDNDNAEIDGREGLAPNWQLFMADPGYARRWAEGMLEYVRETAALQPALPTIEDEDFSLTF